MQNHIRLVLSIQWPDGFNDSVADYMRKLALPHGPAIKLYFQQLYTWPLTFFAAGFFFFLSLQCLKLFLFCAEHKLMTSAGGPSLHMQQI